jgi:hypothetical protein
MGVVEARAKNPENAALADINVVIAKSEKIEGDKARADKEAGTKEVDGRKYKPEKREEDSREFKHAVLKLERRGREAYRYRASSSAGWLGHTRGHQNRSTKRSRSPSAGAAFCPKQQQR